MKIENNNLISESETRKRISYRGYIIRPCKSDDGELYWDIIKPKWSTTEPIWDWCDSVEEAKQWIDSDKDEPFEESLRENTSESDSIIAKLSEGVYGLDGVDTYGDFTESIYKDLELLQSCKDYAEVAGYENEWQLFNWSKIFNKDQDKGIDFRTAKRKAIEFMYKRIDEAGTDLEHAKSQKDEIDSLIPQIEDYIKTNDSYKYIKSDSSNIYFDPIGFDSINDFVKDIARKFNLSNGMFTFDSSFTLHSAYTPKSKAELKIGVEDGNGIIKLPHIIAESIKQLKHMNSEDSLIESTNDGGHLTINFGYWLNSKSFQNKQSLLKFLRSHIISSSSVITLAKNVTDDYENSIWYDTAENVQKFNLTDEQRHEIFEKGYTLINNDINEQMNRNPEDDGWPGIVKDITAQFFDRAAAIKYEIDNCVRGSFTVRGRGTVEDLITDLKELSIDLDYAIKDLTRDKTDINEAKSNLTNNNYKQTANKLFVALKPYGAIKLTDNIDTMDINFDTAEIGNESTLIYYAILAEGFKELNRFNDDPRVTEFVDDKTGSVCVKLLVYSDSIKVEVSEEPINENVNESMSFLDEINMFKRDLELANNVDDIKDLITNLSDAELKDVLKSEFDTAATNINSLQKLKDHLSDVSDIYVEELDDMMFNEANKVSPLNKKYKGYMIRMDHKYGGYNVYDKYDELEDSGFKSIEAAEKFVDSLDESAKVSNLNLSRNISSNESYSIDDITYETKQSLKNDSAKSFGYDYWYHDSGNILNHKNKIIATYDMDKKRKHKKQYGTYGPVHDSKQFYSPSCEYVVNFNDDYFDTHIPPLKYKGPGDENQMIRKVKSYLKSYFKVNGSNAVLNAKKSINDSINESIKTTSVEPVFKLDRPTKSTLTKNKKYDITFDKNGNFIASTRHGKKFYVYGNIKDANDSVQNDEDMIAAAVREQISIQFNESSTLSKLVKSGYSRKEIQKFFKDETGLDMTPENSEEFKRWSAKFLNSIEESTDRTKSVYCCSECGFEGELFDDECEDLCCPKCHNHHGGFGKCEESICSKYAIYMNDKFQEYVTGTEEDAKERIKDYQREDEADRTMFMLNGIDMPTYTYKLVESDETEDDTKLFDVDENFRIRESNNIVG